ncbi:DUF72 domain-containing protein [Dehalococcoidia bacterium]|nr:DUF72 domain-containing protein [Dehalococcoidia bacterium]
MGNILIGTCSWTDPTLLKSGFYPRDCRTAEGRLRYYSQNFNLVEVDSTYYSLLAERTAELWCRRTPEDFTFDVKAFSLFTQHPTQVQSFPRDIRNALSKDTAQRPRIYYHELPLEIRNELWERFARALLPLDSAGKLGVVLFQFPPWFYPREDNRRYIARCQESLPQYRIAVEFRNGAWLSEKERDRTLSQLRDNDLAYVSVDEPQGFRSSVPLLAEATSDVAVVRFHGRNKENWEKKGIAVVERFKYLYSREELGEWLPRLQSLASRRRELHVLFNNCYGDYGVRNAMDITDLMRSQPLLFPD